MAAVKLIENIGLLALLAYVLVSLRVGEKNFTRFLTAKIIVGVSYGVMSAVVMLDPIVTPFGATLDPRAGPAVMAGVVGGFEGAAVAGVIGALVRYHVIGGPVALGGAVGSVLYGLYGWLVGVVIHRYRIKLNLSTLTLIGLGSVVIVLPSFFVSVDAAKAVEILSKVWPFLLTANLLGVIVVGLVTAHAYRTVNLSSQLKAKNQENEMLGLALRASNPVVITDRSGVTEWVNEGFTKLTGYSADEAIGRKPGEILQGQQTSPATVALMGRCIAEGQGFDVEIMNYSKAGQPYWVSLSCSPIKIGRETVKFVAIQNDISAQVEAANAMRIAKNEAVEANRAKSEFLAAMSHELRTPLNAILGFGQLLDMDPEQRLSAKQTEYAQHIVSSGEHLLQLINDILDLSQIEADRLPLHIESFCAIDVINDCESKMLPMAQKNGVRMSVKIYGDTGQEIKADRLRFRQVVINLLSNAIKYNKAGGSVTVQLLPGEDGFQRVAIADTGVGISAAKRDRLFRNFSRLNSSPDLAGSGAGLGLAVSKMLVERMGGHIGFSSEVDIGSTFWIELPLADNDYIVVWDESFRVGVDPIDADHQRILGQINSLSEPDIPDQTYTSRLGDLLSLVQNHFAREEAIMELCDFPERADHVRSHQNFLSELRAFEQRWLQDNRDEISVQIRVMLCDWWIGHIAVSDKKIAEYAKGRERDIKQAVEALV